MPIRFEAWPVRPIGGQHVGSGPSGVRGTHWSADGYPTGIEAICEVHRSQHKNKIAVQEMIEWAMASAGMKECPSITDGIKRFSDGTAKPFLSPAEYAQLRDDDRFLYNEGSPND